MDSSHLVPKTLIFFFAFLIFLAVFGTLLCGLWLNLLPVKAVLDDGVLTEALLIEKYVSDSEQFWFVYQFTTSTDDTYRSSIQVNETVYATYDLGSVLPMRYQMANPNHNVLDIVADDLRKGYWSMIRLSWIVFGIAVALAFGWLRAIPRFAFLNRLRPI